MSSPLVPQEPAPIRLASDVIVSALEKLGLFPDLALKAANDARLVWTFERLQECVLYVTSYKGKAPGIAMLWDHYLKQGRFPRAPVPLRKVLTDEEVCPVCRDDMAVCGGMHGWAAKFRGMAAGAIWSEPPTIAQDSEGGSA